MVDAERIVAHGKYNPMEMRDSLGLPEHIGNYRILRKLGQGGMGAVYEAEQENPRRTVALKVITGPATSSPESLRRFELEVHVLGMLQHPGIAHIFEAGTFEIEGELRPFFAMELVRGVPLLEWFETRELSTRDRLALLAKICDALHHAHERGVVHRDLKPGNILVTEEGEPKLLDFGVARATNADVQMVTLRTDVGQLVGTLPYMSPEQASGDPTRIDSRSDVYSLGVVGYQLLSGRMPYELDRVMLHEGVRIVREVEARPLSTVVRSLRGDVETIIGKALEKDVERRYDSAAEMASDIRRYLADEPIRARPPSSLYQLGKFARRNKVLVGGVVAVGVALIAGLIGTSLGVVEARRSARTAMEKGEEVRRSALDARAREEEAKLEAARANQLAAFVGSILGGVDPAFAQGVDTTLLERILADTATRVETELVGQPRTEGQVRTLIGQTYFALGKYEAALAQFERALPLYVARGADADAAALDVKKSIAVLKDHLGRRDEALAELTEARDDARALGSDHPVQDVIRCELGVMLMERHSHAEAAELFEETLRWRRAHYGEDHELTLVAMNSLGLLRNKQGRNDEAEALLREHLERRERVNGPQHPETIKAASNLGSFYSDLDRSEEGERLIRRAYATSVVVLGEEHPMTLRYLNHLARTVRRLERFEEARELYTRGLDAQRRTLGPEHPDTLATESSLGHFEREHGNYAEAERLHQHVLDATRRQYGDRAAETLIAELDLATDWMRSGLREDGGLATFERLAKELPAVLGERHDRTLVAWNDLGALYLRLGRFAEAEVTLRRVLDARLAQVGLEHAETYFVRSSLGLALQELGRPDEGLPHLAAMLGGWRRLHGDDDATTQNTADAVLACAAVVEDLGPMEAHLAALVEHQRKRSAVDRRALARSLVLLAESRAALRRFDECVALIDEAVELSTANGGDGGPTVARAFGTLGAIKIARGAHADAEPLLVQCWEGLGAEDLVAKRKAARALAEVHAARGDASGASTWRELAAR